MANRVAHLLVALSPLVVTLNPHLLVVVVFVQIPLSPEFCFSSSSGSASCRELRLRHNRFLAFSTGHEPHAHPINNAATCQPAVARCVCGIPARAWCFAMLQRAIDRQIRVSMRLTQ
jgi:hypothetical protein